LSLGKKKIKIELEDAEGGKYNLSLDGNITKDKVIKVFELIDLLNIEGQSNNNNNNNNTNAEIHPHKSLASVGSKIWSIVEAKFPYSTFTSSDILESYEDEYNEPIKLSIISMYLSRYSERNKLMRSKSGKEWIYKIARQLPVIGATQVPQDVLHQHQQHHHEHEYPYHHQQQHEN
jgi:hypothetical protein